MILWRTLLDAEATFVGDLIVLIYLLVMPALSVMLGSFASRNPLASLGGSREVKLMIAYELPLVLAVLVPVIQANSIRLGDLLVNQAPVTSLSGVLGLLVCIACMQAKLTLVPFDMPEAETELSGGALIEYSGPPLAMFKLTRAMMLFTMPVLLVVLFFGGLLSGPAWQRAVDRIPAVVCAGGHHHRHTKHHTEGAHRPGRALFLGTGQRHCTAGGHTRLAGMVMS